MLQDYEAFKNVLVERGEKFGDVALKARAQIATQGSKFIEDGVVRPVLLLQGWRAWVVAAETSPRAPFRRPCLCTGFLVSCANCC